MMASFMDERGNYTALETKSSGFDEMIKKGITRKNKDRIVKDFERYIEDRFGNESDTFINSLKMVIEYLNSQDWSKCPV